MGRKGTPFPLVIVPAPSMFVEGIPPAFMWLVWLLLVELALFAAANAEADDVEVFRFFFAVVFVGGGVSAAYADFSIAAYIL